MRTHSSNIIPDIFCNAHSISILAITINYIYVKLPPRDKSILLSMMLFPT